MMRRPTVEPAEAAMPDELRDSRGPADRAFESVRRLSFHVSEPFVDERDATPSEKPSLIERLKRRFGKRQTDTDVYPLW